MELKFHALIRDKAKNEDIVIIDVEQPGSCRIQINMFSDYRLLMMGRRYFFARATSQVSCMHEHLATAATMRSEASNAVLAGLVQHRS